MNKATNKKLLCAIFIISIINFISGCVSAFSYPYLDKEDLTGSTVFYISVLIDIFLLLAFLILIIINEVKTNRYYKRKMELQSTVTCPNCDLELEASTSFCPSCGSEIKREKIVIDDREKMPFKQLFRLVIFNQGDKIVEYISFIFLASWTLYLSHMAKITYLTVILAICLSLFLIIIFLLSILSPLLSRGNKNSRTVTSIDEDSISLDSFSGQAKDGKPSALNHQIFYFSKMIMYRETEEVIFIMFIGENKNQRFAVGLTKNSIPQEGLDILRSNLSKYKEKNGILD